MLLRNHFTKWFDAKIVFQPSNVTLYSFEVRNIEEIWYAENETSKRKKWKLRKLKAGHLCRATNNAKKKRTEMKYKYCGRRQFKMIRMCLAAPQEKTVEFKNSEQTEKTRILLDERENMCVSVTDHSAVNITTYDVDRLYCIEEVIVKLTKLVI